MIKVLKELGLTKPIWIYTLFFILFCNGCAAALVGGAFYHSVKSKGEKREFMDNYNKTNIEREKAGLPPLDLCTEKYHFDEGYAKDDPPCKKRVEAHEAGDETALGQPQLVEQTGTDEGQGKDEGMSESEE